MAIAAQENPDTPATTQIASPQATLLAHRIAAKTWARATAHIVQGEIVQQSGGTSATRYHLGSAHRWLRKERRVDGQILILFE